MTQGSNVALTCCFFCGKSDKILLATRYRHDGEPVHDLSKLDGTVTDMEPCSECAGLMTQGILFLGIREGEGEKLAIAHEAAKTENRKNSIPNPYRTGDFVVIKEESVRRMFEGSSELEPLLKRRWSFMERANMVQAGMIRTTSEVR